MAAIELTKRRESYEKRNSFTFSWPQYIHLRALYLWFNLGLIKSLEIG
jgi:hypothetical protein